MPFSIRLVAALGFALSFGAVEGWSGTGPHLRKPAAVSYQGRKNCPELCSTSGPNPANWTAYHNLDQVAHCQETVFYHFSIHDAVDVSSTPHRIFACTSYGAPQKPGVVAAKDQPATQTLSNASFVLGSWNDLAPKGVNLIALSKQMRLLLDAGYTADGNKSLVLFAQSVTGTAGLYMGKSVRAQGTATQALTAMENAMFQPNNTFDSGSSAMQLCGPGYDTDHVFGFIATSNNFFTPVQQALQLWANATCLTFDRAQNITGTVSFTTPLVHTSNTTFNGTIARNSTSHSARQIRGSSLERRGDCSTVQVVGGDSCGSLATKCGISPSDFTKYNPDSKLCGSLIPGQHVCCSSGTLPSFKPSKNSDGSCHTYTVAADDTCAGLGAGYDLTPDDIEGFNKNTWAWNGCNLLYIGNIICLSDGSPPMPAPLANAICGPQKPGTRTPSSGTANISSLNPCPLNACCDVWGQCGITKEFCTDTGTGAPGTAKKGTNGCISNCGTDVIKSGAPAEFIKLGYFEGFSMARPCLNQDARQIDVDKFSHVHFAFGVLSPDFQVSTGDDLNTYEFKAFLRLTGVKKVLSFGGWAFSTEPATYNIFRTGVQPANRQKLATNIANFINANNLDGVDIDWEYPGEPDIPGIPAGSEDDGANYLKFLVTLKNLLPGKTVSIAAPASYWYLKAFPIPQIAKVVDYIVFMTYDLHGQWDAGNTFSQEGCSTGNCLRSHVNLTETMTALAMVTKAGAPSNKIVVGVSSYGRSFAMSSAGCTGPSCFFTGSATASNAAEGPCTGTAGYISDAEIYDIVKNNASRVTKDFIDKDSNSRIVVYDNTQWVAFMDDSIRSERSSLYSGLQMGGTTNWATDLEEFVDAPDQSKSWSNFKLQIKTGEDPYAEGPRTGNWTKIGCDDRSVQDVAHLYPDERWSMADAPDAWSNCISTWKDYDSKKHNTFTASVSNTIHGPEQADCGTLLDTNNCHQTLQCSGFPGGQAGAAGYMIWNSMVIVHEIYASYQSAIVDAAALTIDPSLNDFENTFAPVPPPPDDTWLDILLTCVDLVGVVGVSHFFNKVLKSMPYFDANKVTYDTSKDTAKALVSFSTSLAGTLTGKGDDGSGWTAKKQDAFSDYLGQAITGWAAVNEKSLAKLFDGSDDSVTLLASTIANGHLVEGSGEYYPAIGAPKGSQSLSDLSNVIAKGFFAFAMTTVWPLSDKYPFVMDTGYDCGTIDPMGKYIDTDTMHITYGCYNNKLYYLVYPDGDSKVKHTNCGDHGPCQITYTDNTFSAPPGVNTLDGQRWGGVSVTDIIAGSVRTYNANGNQNGGKATDPANGGSLDDLMSEDFTTPGFIRLPVCTAEIAWAAWDEGTDKKSPNWPCYVKPSKDDCGLSTMIDQTSDASPSVSDCMEIVSRIQGTQGEWEVENAVEQQHGILKYGGCAFGVQGKKINGNINFHVGAQDVVDIITDAVKQFGGGGKVGAKGNMDCRGDVSTVPIEWGLY